MESPRCHCVSCLNNKSIFTKFGMNVVPFKVTDPNNFKSPTLSNTNLIDVQVYGIEANAFDTVLLLITIISTD